MQNGQLGDRQERVWRDMRQKKVSTAAGGGMAPRDALTQSPRTCEQVTSLVKGVLREGRATDLESGVILDYPGGPVTQGPSCGFGAESWGFGNAVLLAVQGGWGHKLRDVSSS